MKLEALETTDRIPRGSIPLYFQIERVLRTRIGEGEYPPGSSLPNEAQLCEQFGVSRSTVRQALAVLQREGLITRRAGKGTSVAIRAPGEAYPASLGSFQDFFMYARETTYHHLSAAAVNPPPEVAERLKISPGSQVMGYRGLRSGGGRPFVFVTSWLPMSIGRQFTKEDMQHGPMVLLVGAKFGINIAEIQQHLGATLANKEIAELLDVRARSPILLAKRLYLSAGGDPVDFTINYFCPDRFEYQQRFVRSGARDR
ncbi:MAG: GntR family transcriptional regulator [Pseudomonadota bacterium]